MLLPNALLSWKRWMLLMLTLEDKIRFNRVIPFKRVELLVLVTVDSYGISKGQKVGSPIGIESLLQVVARVNIPPSMYM